MTVVTVVTVFSVSLPVTLSVTKATGMTGVTGVTDNIVQLTVGVPVGTLLPRKLPRARPALALAVQFNVVLVPLERVHTCHIVPFAPVVDE